MQCPFSHCPGFCFNNLNVAQRPDFQSAFASKSSSVPAQVRAITSTYPTSSRRCDCTRLMRLAFAAVILTQVLHRSARPPRQSGDPRSQLAGPAVASGPLRQARGNGLLELKAGGGMPRIFSAFRRLASPFCWSLLRPVPRRHDGGGCCHAQISDRCHSGRGFRRLLPA
jgi:hypothetical protein